MNKFFLITLIISFCLLALDSQAQSFEELIKQGDDYTVQKITSNQQDNIILRLE